MIELLNVDVSDYGEIEELEKIKNALSEKESIVKSIKMTSIACPEQYECFDEYGNQVGYLRLRWGSFTVECPDCGFGGTIVFTGEPEGDGLFCNHERLGYLLNAIDAIDNFYENVLKTICKEETEEDEFYFMKDNTTEEEMKEMLYEYQQSNFTPYEVQALRKRGPMLSFKEAIMKIIRTHRLLRARMFPEANGRDGLLEEHIEMEVQWFKDTTDELGCMVKCICKLWNKTFKDFEIIFRDASTKGGNSL